MEDGPLYCTGEGTICQDDAGSAAQLHGGDHRNSFFTNTSHCLRASFKYTATKYILQHVWVLFFFVGCGQELL